MKSAIAILTYRRLHALRTMMSGVELHCPQYQTAIFEDCGQRDATTSFLSAGRVGEAQPHLLATKYPGGTADVTYPNATVYIGSCNLGVTGNSNRALRWFMDSGCDHLLLCNDDLHVSGDFAKFYAQAHADLGVGLFCFCDFTHHESYRWTPYRWRGYTLKMLPRFTGIMMSITRELVEKVGYYDAEFGKFGEEHCDYTIRCRMAGGIRCDGMDFNCLDVEHTLLRHQEVATSVVGNARQQADQEAHLIMQRAAFEYRMRHYYRPFRLQYPVMSNGYYGSGIPCRQLEQIGYKLAGGPVVRT